MTGPAAALKRLLEVFDQLGIPYMVGGSLATSIHGIPRSTNDVDLVAEVKTEHIARIAAELSRDFYADAEMMKDALRHGRMFNLIHYGSSYKFDIYPLSREPYYQAEFARRKTEEWTFDGREVLKVPVATPEDAILSKLLWYRASRGVLERQFSDALDVIRVQGDRLDVAYLRKWAASLGVEDLLDLVLREAK